VDGEVGEVGGVGAVTLGVCGCIVELVGSRMESMERVEDFFGNMSVFTLPLR